MITALRGRPGSLQYILGAVAPRRRADDRTGGAGRGGHCRWPSSTRSRRPCRWAAPTALLCYGHCFHRRRPGDRARADRRRPSPPPDRRRMPRLDLYRWLQQTGEDPRGRSYRSGWWATVPVPAQDAGPPAAGQAAVRLEDGARRLVVPLAEIAVDAMQPPPTRRRARRLYRRGRSRSAWPPSSRRSRCSPPRCTRCASRPRRRWLCVISDGGSAPERLSEMRAVLDGDERFVLSPSQRRLSPYRNFERALTLAPAGAELRRAVRSGRPLVSGQARRPARGARVGVAGLLRPATRRPRMGGSCATRCGSAVATTAATSRRCWWPTPPRAPRCCSARCAAGAGAAVSGACPACPTTTTGWLWWRSPAETSRTSTAPLYDYVQHRGAVQGALSEAPSAAPGASGSRGWRAAYFGGYCAAQARKRRRCWHATRRRSRPPRKRRALRADDRRRASRRARSPGWCCARCGGCGGATRHWAARRRWPAGSSWRWLVAAAVAGRERPGGRPWDASFPDPPRFEQRRLRRWRAGG